jgi:MFS family permease
MATGPVAGGWLFDTLGTYRWLYLGSGLIGLGAFLISLTLKSAPRYSPDRPPADLISARES